MWFTPVFCRVYPIIPTTSFFLDILSVVTSRIMQTHPDCPHLPQAHSNSSRLPQAHSGSRPLTGNVSRGRHRTVPCLLLIFSVPSFDGLEFALAHEPTAEDRVEVGVVEEEFAALTAESGGGLVCSFLQPVCETVCVCKGLSFEEEFFISK